MAVFIALLRAVNVGGTGKLAMSDLRVLCEAAGFAAVTTYIQSGNVVFTAKLSAAKTQAKLETALAKQLGKPVGVLLRTPDELEATLAKNPFAKAPPNRVLVFFYDAPPKASAFRALTIPGPEEVRVSGREVFVHYPLGQGRSKLKLPGAEVATGRNLNTVRALAELARSIAG